ncbi:hypothetical protein [Paenibacillus silvisoli]|uniref:hypothetical protein n=1 Tax=Paenibacillus silvisoli TaxID=3110539 RepID=UPI00280568C6|nr:hypothetical protein [Paenibacillus silvisoli]
MSKDHRIKSMLPEKVNMTPDGFAADQLSPEAFTACCELFFDSILEIGTADISGVEGYGEFNEECETAYATCRAFLVETFSEDREGYWYNWKEMFETTELSREFFEHYFKEMEDRISYCEGRRFLVNNNTFFMNMITDGQTRVGFPDWSRAGISDFLLDLAIMDLHKPYMKVPELFAAYCKKKNIVIPDFKERFLCMAYYKGIDVLRWHASIDDTESCYYIKRSISELKDRINAI